MVVAAFMLASWLGAGTAASACTVMVPYTPLNAVPIATEQMLLVDVVELSFGRRGAVAEARVVRAIRGRAKPGDRLALSYLQSPCGQTREPNKAERLIVYEAKGRGIGWATVAEARRFDPAVR